MARFLLSKHRRVVLSRSIKGFWQEYSHNKIGLIGLIIVILYVLTAVLAPWLAPYDPTETIALAEPFSQPEWITMFPGLGKLPRTMIMPMSWSVTDLPESMNIIESGENIIAEYNGTTMQTANFTSTFVYRYDAPYRFHIIFTWLTENVKNAKYSMELSIANPAGNEFLIWTSYSNPERQFSLTNKSLAMAVLYSSTLQSHLIQRLVQAGISNLAQATFTEPGEYKLKLQIKVGPKYDKQPGTAKIQFQDMTFTILGLVHGVLGTDHAGADVFSQLIYGAQISLAVGLSSAILATSIGILVGVIAGYIGGFVDEGLMRTVDILLALPVLPLLLGLIVIFGTSVWYLVMLIALFGWLGLSRIIRSRVLSLKEMPFIECARAAGASRAYIMRKHIIPNVIPVALAALILSVPAAILTEAGISFIGLGDPSTPTWGRMLYWAFNSAALWKLAWWWLIPPGMAITILTMAFVFIGHAVDEIVNPKLRRRR